MAQAALRLQRVHQPLERQVLVRVRLAASASRTRPSSVAEAGVAGQTSARSASVLTKKPISPSVSGRVRPAIGVPTATSVLPV